MKPAKQNNMGGAWTVAIPGMMILIMCIAGLTGKFGPIDEFGQIFSWVILVAALGLLWIAYLVYRSNKKNYHEFYQLFPELNGSMETVVSQASYVSEKLGVLIYKDYLVSYRIGYFNFVPLKKVTQLTYHWERARRNRPAEAFLVTTLQDEEKSKHLQVTAVTGKTRTALLNDLYAYLQKYYGQIQFK